MGFVYCIVVRDGWDPCNSANPSPLAMGKCKQGCGGRANRYVVHCPSSCRPFELVSNNGIDNPALKLKNNKGECINGDLIFCTKCANDLVEGDMKRCTGTDNKRLLFGHVSEAKKLDYFKYIELSKILREQGYIEIVKANSFIFKKFPHQFQWEDLLQEVLCDVSTKRFNTLFSTKGKSGVKFRRWCDLIDIKGKAKGSTARWGGDGVSPSPSGRPNAIAAMSDWSRHVAPIFDPDLYISRVAMTNNGLLGGGAGELCDESDIDAINILVRLAGLNINQDLHQDSMINHGFMIEPLTADYEIYVVPGSHKFVHNGVEENTPRRIPRERVKRVVLNPDRVLLCFSRTLHGGGKSRGYLLNEREKNITIPIKRDSIEGLEKRMYNTTNFSEKDKITDLSFQYAFKLTDLTLSSGHATGKVGTIGAYPIIDEGDEEYTNILGEYDRQWAKMEQESKQTMSKEMENMYNLIMGRGSKNPRSKRRKTSAV